MREARAWLAEDPDPVTREELSDLLRRAESADPTARAALADRFGARLAFGTAGLRGAMGAGPNRMNRVVVQRAAAGLGSYLRTRGGGRVVVGYDARHNSRTFARDTAAVLAGAGLDALLLAEPAPTPLLAFALRHLDAAAGVMVTASHNPAPDNGYKVYLGDGSQIVPPADAAISAAIDAVGPLPSIRRSDGWTTAGPDLVESYLLRLDGLLPPGPRDLRIAYTPLHGVGLGLVRESLRRAGFAAPVVVPEQAEPDPDFPTVPFPNPEEPGVMGLVSDLGRRIGADLVLASDPDADRCAVAVPLPTGPRLLTGDEVGALLGQQLVDRGARGTFASTIVSSSLLGKIAARNGLEYAETLTGFKWIGRVPGLRYGYEEALGYCVDPPAVADKDGISALLLVAELAAGLKERGRTLLDLLDDLALDYGVHATGQESIRVSGADRVRSLLDRLRKRPPATLGGRALERSEDLAAGAGGLPPTPGQRYVLSDGSRVVVRPSGTEPKLKCYVEVVRPVSRADVQGTREAAARDLAAIRGDLTGYVGRGG